MIYSLSKGLSKIVHPVIMGEGKHARRVLSGVRAWEGHLVLNREPQEARDSIKHCIRERTWSFTSCPPKGSVKILHRALICEPLRNSVCCPIHRERAEATDRCRGSCHPEKGRPVPPHYPLSSILHHPRDVVHNPVLE